MRPDAYPPGAQTEDCWVLARQGGTQECKGAQAPGSMLPAHSQPTPLPEGTSPVKLPRCQVPEIQRLPSGGTEPTEGPRDKWEAEFDKSFGSGEASSSERTEEEGGSPRDCSDTISSPLLLID